MRRRWNLALTAAICASLLMHGLVYDAVVVRETQEVAATIHQPAFDLQAWLQAHREMNPLPQKDEPVPPIAANIKPPEIDIEELFGERGAKGKGLNSTPGEKPLESRQADQDQAALTPHPGAPSNGGNGGQSSASPAQPKPPTKVAMVDQPSAAPSMTIDGPHSDDPIGAPLIPAPPPIAPKAFKEPKPIIIGQTVPERETSPTTRSAVTLDDSPATRPVETKSTTRPVDVALAHPTTSPIVDSASTRPVTVAVTTQPPMTLPEGKLPSATQPTPDKPPTTRPVRVAVASIDNVHPMEAPASASTSGSPGHGPAGEAGNPSESESDEFSDHATTVYRNGRVEARDGRKVKSVRPKLNEAGRLALASMERPVIIIKAKIDANGKVTDADYLKKSDIPEVDLPHLRAAYEWEFEPTHDATGKAVPDTQIISFVWQ